MKPSPMVLPVGTQRAAPSAAQGAARCAPTGHGPAGRALALAAVLFLLSACAGTVRLGKLLGTGDSGGTFQVQVGREVVVLVPWPDQPGWMWMVQQRDSSRVRLAGRQRSDSIKALQDVKGTGGKEALRFKAVAAGTSELVIVYCQVSDCERTAKKTVTYRIEASK